MIINDYCKKYEIYRHNIRFCDLPKISELIDIKIVALKKNGKYYRPSHNEYDILVYTFD